MRFGRVIVIINLLIIALALTFMLSAVMSDADEIGEIDDELMTTAVTPCASIYRRRICKQRLFGRARRRAGK